MTSVRGASAWDPSGPAHRPQAPARAVALATALVLACGAGGLSLMGLSRARYGVDLPWQPPAHITYCGHAYREGSRVTAAPSVLVARTPGHPQWRLVGHTLALADVYAAVPPGAASPGTAGTACPSTLYLSFGGHRYLRYSRS